MTVPALWRRVYQLEKVIEMLIAAAGIQDDVRRAAALEKVREEMPQ